MLVLVLFIIIVGVVGWALTSMNSASRKSPVVKSAGDLVLYKEPETVEAVPEPPVIHQYFVDKAVFVKGELKDGRLNREDL